MRYCSSRGVWVCVVFALALACGCGGGMPESGGQLFDGVVTDSGGRSLGGVAVTLLETGESVETDEAGQFSIQSDPVAGPVEFLLESQSVIGRSVTKDIPEDRGRAPSVCAFRGGGRAPDRMLSRRSRFKSGDQPPSRPARRQVQLRLRVRRRFPLHHRQLGCRRRLFPRSERHRVRLRRRRMMIPMMTMMRTMMIMTISSRRRHQQRSNRARLRHAPRVRETPSLRRGLSKRSQAGLSRFVGWCFSSLLTRSTAEKTESKRHLLHFP
jgi:hypothetical protein